MTSSKEKAFRVVYAPLSEDQRSAASDSDEAPPPEDAAPRPGRLPRRFVAGTLLVTATVGTVLALAGPRGAGGRLKRLPRGPAAEAAFEEKDDATWIQGADFPSQAPKMDIDTEYQVNGGWGTNYDHIPSPEMCAAMCQGVEKCQAYTWVKDAGLPGCPSQCWLKDSVGVKHPKKGLVSGVPPPRKELTAGVVKAAAGTAGNTLYCFSLMVPGGYEEGLLQWQHDHKAGIFGCDKAAVYSNKAITIAPGIVSEVVNSTLKCSYGGDSQSALNAWIFIAVWQKVIEVGDYKPYSWVVKADPDAVFFPDRLSRLVSQHAGAGYINNCKYGMHGPIEVFSSHAIDTLGQDYKASWDGKAPKQCVTGQHFGQWGEDMFMDQCLEKVLKVSPRPLDENLMCESHCDCPSWYWCNDGPDMVSYHPFKTIEAYKNCMANALGMPAIAGAASLK